MIAKKTKILALAVVGMMCAVAIIGAAYAAFAGTASTYNEGNTANTAYITIEGSTANGATEWGAFTVNSSAVPMDTHKYHKVVETVDTDYIAYSLNTTGATTVNGHSAFLIGTKAFVITNNTSAAITAINLTLTAGSDLGTKFVFTAAAGEVEDDFDATTESVTLENVACNAAADGGSATVTVNIYASAGTYDVKVPANKIGPATSETPYNAWEVLASNAANFKVLDNVSFAILAEEYVATP